MADPSSTSVSALITVPGLFRKRRAARNRVRTVPRGSPDREFWASVSDRKLEGHGRVAHQPELVVRLPRRPTSIVVDPVRCWGPPLSDRAKHTLVPCWSKIRGQIRLHPPTCWSAHGTGGSPDVTPIRPIVLNGDRREHNKILPTKGHPEGAGQSFEISMAREGDFGAHSPSLILPRGVGKLVRSLNSWGCRPWMVWGTRVHIKTYCCLEGIRLGLIRYYWQRLDDVERAVGVAHGGHTGSDTGGPKFH